MNKENENIEVLKEEQPRKNLNNGPNKQPHNRYSNR